MTAFDDDSMGTQNAEVLGDAGMSHTKEFLDRVDVEFPASEFFHDSDSFRVGQDTEQFGAYTKDEIVQWGKAVRDSGA